MAQEIEILISEDGHEMKVTAHNFQGQGCESLVRAFQCGTITDSGPTAEYFQRQTQKNTLKQGR